MSAYRIIVFDFDGTLVESNEEKRQAFLELFEDGSVARSAMKQVLEEYPEESRYRLIEETLRRIKTYTERELSACVEDLAGRYGDSALEAVRNCPEKSGASELLSRLSRSYKLFLSSGTPLEPLDELVAARGWDMYFSDIFGYPARKADTLMYIAKREGASARSILVVGDGESDRQAASAVGCKYFHAEPHDSMKRLEAFLSQ